MFDFWCQKNPLVLPFIIFSEFLFKNSDFSKFQSPEAATENVL